MSKRPHTTHTRLNPDPAAGNIRDPEQHNDELTKHDAPKHEDPTQRKKARSGRADGE